MWCHYCRSNWRELAIWRVKVMTVEEQNLAAFGGGAFARKLRDGGSLVVALLPNGMAELRHQPAGGIENSWYYTRLVGAIAAAAHWVPEPEGKNAEPRGWSFHPISGRRRQLGDASRESRN